MSIKNWLKRYRNEQADIDPIPEVDLEMESVTVDCEVRELRDYKFNITPYVEPTDKEILEGLEFQDNYEAAFRLRQLKIKNGNLKRKLTILQKKYDELLDAVTIKD